MTFKELLIRVLVEKFDYDIVSRVLELYPDQNFDIYLDVIKELLTIEPVESDVTLTLKNCQDDELGDLTGKKIDYVDVSGYNFNMKEFYAIEFRPWEEWLGMEIAEKSLNEFPLIDIAAHCLWEMTFVSYTNKDVKAQWNEVQKLSSDLEKGIEDGSFIFSDEILDFDKKEND